MINALLLVFMLCLGAYIFKPYILAFFFALALAVVLLVPGDERKVGFILWLSRVAGAGPDDLRVMARNQRNLGLKSASGLALSNRMSSALEAEASRLETEK